MRSHRLARTPSPHLRTTLLAAASVAVGGLLLAGGDGSGPGGRLPPRLMKDVGEQLREGRQAFRHDTFGDEEFWGGELELHLAIAGAANGGVGDGLTPAKALELGLKLDRAALSDGLIHQLKSGTLDVTDPANTVALLRADAVVGVTGFFDGDQLTAVGINCALCHSTVDDSVMTGVGNRLDGWANRDLDVGKIVALAPDLTPFTTLLGLSDQEVRDALSSWGPGKFDAELVLDGQNAPTLIPPAFGLAGVNLHTWTGWGSVPYWNAFVAVIEMHGKGNFFDARLDDAGQFPVAAQAGFGHITVAPEDDRVTPKLPSLHLYQLSLQAPDPPKGSFDPDAAERGDELFEGKAQCASCHVEPTFTDSGWNLHTGPEIGIDNIQADRSPTHAYRTSPLKGLWTHTKGGFFHDGRFATLDDVVAHYDQHFALGLTDNEKSDLVQYLLSL
jgi:mono/diheme cytochrome c family protein